MRTRARQFRRLRLPIVLLALMAALLALPALTTAPAEVPLAAEASFPVATMANT
ncbi:MAG: hypothetical protein JWR75_1705 [Devosia sp.]|nr:hypothetical protein [Devosia sp.]